ncbi:MAG: TorD/DmsD family molecular chaperone [bacterium]
MPSGRAGEGYLQPLNAFPMHLVDLARFRQTAYRLFAASLLYPDEERLATLVLEARALKAESDPLAAFPFFGHWQSFLDALQGIVECEVAGVEGEYVRLFLVNPVAPPYESFYLDPQGQSRGWIVAQLGREYNCAGLTLSPSLGEPPDFVAVELEFMSFLCGKEVQSWEGEDLEQNIRVLDRQRAFLGRHLGRWFPPFAWQVRKEAPEGLYGVVVEAADAFVQHDVDLLDLLVEGVLG